MTSSETQNLQTNIFRQLHSTGLSYGNKHIFKTFISYLLRPGPNLNLQSPDPGAGAEQSTAIALPLFAACEVLADQVKVIHNYVTCVI